MDSTGKFAGIQKYNSTDIVDNYINLIPIGDQIVDRLGTKIVKYLPDNIPLSQFSAVSSWCEFVCSNGDILMATTPVAGYNTNFGVKLINRPEERFSFEGFINIPVTNHKNCEMVEDTDSKSCVYACGNDSVTIITPGLPYATGSVRNSVLIRGIGTQGNSRNPNATGTDLPSGIVDTYSQSTSPTSSWFIPAYWNYTTNSKSIPGDNVTDNHQPVTKWDIINNTIPTSSSNPDNIKDVFTWNFSTDTSVTLNDWYNAYLNNSLADPYNIRTGLYFTYDQLSPNLNENYNITIENINGLEYDDTLGSDLVSIDWFDNRIVLADKIDNRIWLSSSFPAEDLLNEDMDGIGTFTQRWRMTFWLDRDFTQLSPENEPTVWATFTDVVFPNWYSSTNTNNIINRVRQLNGNLYVLYSHLIECWVRTGEDNAPIIINLNNCISTGGIECKVLNGFMYFIGVDDLDNTFVARTAGDGRMERLSNQEIEKRIQKINRICHLRQRQDTFIGFYNAPTPSANDLVTPVRRPIYYIGERCGWWIWDNSHLPHTQYDVNNLDPPTDCSWWLSSCLPVRSLFEDYLVYSNISILLGTFFDGARTDEIMEIIDDTPTYQTVQFPIRRELMYGSTDLSGARGIVSYVQMVCDTSTKFNDIPDGDYPVMLQLSFDNGRTWQRGLTRLLSQVGSNQKIMIWRSMGSGWQYILKFSIDNEFPLLIRDMNIDVK